MLAAFRKMYNCTDPTVTSASSPELFAHRDFIYREHLELSVGLQEDWGIAKVSLTGK
jgi:hypothetical protein